MSDLDVNAGPVGRVLRCSFCRPGIAGGASTVSDVVRAAAGSRSRSRKVGGGIAMPVAFERVGFVGTQGNRICSDTASALDVDTRAVGRVLRRSLSSADRGCAVDRGIPPRAVIFAATAVGVERTPVQAVSVALERVGFVGTKGDRICSDMAGLDVNAGLVGHMRWDGLNTSASNTRGVKRGDCPVGRAGLITRVRGRRVERASRGSTGLIDAAPGDVLNLVALPAAERSRICSDTASALDVNARLVGRVDGASFGGCPCSCSDREADLVRGEGAAGVSRQASVCRPGASRPLKHPGRCRHGAADRTTRAPNVEGAGHVLQSVELSSAEVPRICSDTLGLNVDAWRIGRVETSGFAADRGGVLNARKHVTAKRSSGTGNRVTCNAAGNKAPAGRCPGRHIHARNRVCSRNSRGAVFMVWKPVELAGAEVSRICSDMAGLDVDARLVGGMARCSFGSAVRHRVVAVRVAITTSGCSNSRTASSVCCTKRDDRMGVSLERVGLVLAKQDCICSDTPALDVDARFVRRVLWRSFSRAGSKGLRRPIAVRPVSSGNLVASKACRVRRRINAVYVAPDRVGLVGAKRDRICSDMAALDVDARPVRRVARRGLSSSRRQRIRSKGLIVGKRGIDRIPASTSRRLRQAVAVRFNSVCLVRAEGDRICSAKFFKGEKYGKP